MDLSKISVVIPAHNEEKFIEGTVKEYCSVLGENFADFEIIIVSNNCSDNTERIAERLSSENNKIKHLILREAGKGLAVKKGVEITKFELFGFADADNSAKASEFLKLVSAMRKENAVCVIGSRDLPESVLVKKQPWHRRAMGFFYAKIVRLMFGLKVRDSQCGAKLFFGKKAKRVFRDLKSKGFGFDVEVLWKLKKEDCKIEEVPIKWEDKPYSKVGFKAPFSMFCELIRARLE